MSDPTVIRALADEIKDVFVGCEAPVVMSALTLITAEALASCDMAKGKSIDDAMAIFTKQVRAIYTVLDSETQKGLS